MQDHHFWRALIVAGALLCLSDLALAHHSISPYDMASLQELEGTVSAIRWVNPHIRLTLQVDGEAWEVEGDSANAAARQGLTRDSVRVGDQVRIAGWPSTLGRREVFLTNILLGGMETVVMDLDLPRVFTEAGETGPGERDAQPDRGIFRVWSSSGEIYRLRNPYRLTPAAEAAREGWDPYTDMLSLSCIAPGMPNAILNPYPIEFVDMGDRILIRIEEWEAVRSIDMTSRSIPEDAPGSLLGYSVGDWEDDLTLVVETAAVDFPYLDDAGTPMSADVRMSERFTLTEDGNDLAYEISVTDPENLAEPVIWDAAWTWIPGTAIQPYECDIE